MVTKDTQVPMAVQQNPDSSANDKAKKEAEAEQDKLLKLTKSFARLFPRRHKKECQYCCESKPLKSFALASAVPHGCRVHLRGVCKNCLEASLGAQLDSKPLLEVGCPSCSIPWDSEDLRTLLGHKDKKRFRDIDFLAKNMALVPSDLPEGVTLDQMLERGMWSSRWRTCRH